MPATTTVFLVRHGSRHDFTRKDEWAAACGRLGLEPSDPPLSALGHEQARQAAAVLAARGVNAILSSPYLRAIQTAVPLAHALAAPIFVEPAIAEWGQNPSLVPRASQRVAVYPEVDDTYVPLLCLEQFEIGATTGVEDDVEYLRRMLYAAAALSSETSPYCGKTVALFSHGASVSLVAALTNQPSLEAAGLFAPAGIYELSSDNAGKTWRIIARGDDNTAHISTNHPGTFPWGFKHSLLGMEGFELLWQQARALGPMVPRSARSTPSSSVSRGTAAVVVIAAVAVLFAVRCARLP